MANKMTIADKFASIISKAEKGEPLQIDDIGFLQERADQAAKKSATRKPTKDQIANEGFKQDILDVMSANPNMIYTITDLMKSVPALAGLSNQKVSAIVRQLREAALVVRTESKGKAFFQIAP